MERRNSSARRQRTSKGVNWPSDIIREKFAKVFLSGDNSELDLLLRDIARIAPPSESPEKFFRLMASLLAAAAHSVIEESLNQKKLWNLALTDDLTGLHNRRGFFAIGDQQLKVARRNQQSTLLFFIDIDGLKQINDHFGHAEGSRAIVRVARILKGTFRESDIIARLGGDEFVILANEATSECQDDIWRRLNEALDSAQTRSPLYKLSLSIGVAKFDPGRTVSLEDLMNCADQAMYEAKRTSLSGRFHQSPAPPASRDARSSDREECSGAAVPSTLNFPSPPKSARLRANPLEQSNAAAVRSRNWEMQGAVGQFGHVYVAYQKSVATCH